MASFKVNFNFPRFQGDPTYAFQGMGDQTFFLGGQVQLLIDSTCDLYLTTVLPSDPHNYHNIFSTTVFLFWVFIFVFHHVPNIDACFTLIQKWGLVGSLFQRCVRTICFCAWIKGYCRLLACLGPGHTFTDHLADSTTD